MLTAMRLIELAAALPGARAEAGGDYDVRRVVSDSRRSGPGDLFVAIAGASHDGHDFATAAAARGAAVAVERMVALPEGTPALRLAGTRWGLGALAAALEGHPARRLAMVGVTGTNGKTTVTHMAAHLLSRSGVRAGYLSTVGVRTAERAERENRSGLSTMGAAEIQRRLAEMVDAGQGAAVVEATSHALDQGRVSGCEFDVAALTNIGVDHQDYHRGPEAYFEAKASLIDLCQAAEFKGTPKTAVLNADDISFERLRRRPIQRQVSYSIFGDADLSAQRLVTGPSGSRFLLRVKDAEAEVRLAMPGAFNVANALCAAAACQALTSAGAELLAAGLSDFPGVPGRLQPIDRGQPFRVFVDFAHSAAGLESVLGCVRPLAGSGGRVLLVFGSTGRADHDRPGMGRAAAAGADWFVITTDDPVGEDPAAIARDVEAGVGGRTRGRDYEVEPDRREAIRMAVARAKPGDLVLLAGKGHERTMRGPAGAEPWNEAAEADVALRGLGY
jgi:UDP-N-acetylmuramoyl-L-alanyl-D-glutamate--2,6-diaminopimelate ligase